MNAPTYIAPVHWFSEEKNYGYLVVDDALRAELKIPPGKDLFLHRSDLIGFPKPLPQAGQVLQFNVREAPRGLRAVNAVIRCPERAAAIRTGNVFRDAMANNRGISTNS